MGEQWKRVLTDDEVRELRVWWTQREAAYFAYINTPNPREMGQAMGISPDTARRVGMGVRYKGVK